LAPGNFDYVIATRELPAGGSERISDPQAFMERLIVLIENLVAKKQVNIYGDATALPENLKTQYDALWTPERMDRVIKALKDANVAMEINDRLRVPSPAFINRAKAAGVRFTFGSGNTGPNDLGRLAYCIAMIEECRLAPNNLWLP
jgi:histidinol phosphatase-like PHP family hydrolase